MSRGIHSLKLTVRPMKTERLEVWRFRTWNLQPFSGCENAVLVSGGYGHSSNHHGWCLLQEPRCRLLRPWESTHHPVGQGFASWQIKGVERSGVRAGSWAVEPRSAAATNGSCGWLAGEAFWGVFWHMKWHNTRGSFTWAKRPWKSYRQNPRGMYI